MPIRFNQLFNLSVYWVPSFLALRPRAGQQVSLAFPRSTDASRRADRKQGVYFFYEKFSAAEKTISARITRFLLANGLQIKKELQTYVCNSSKVGAPGFEPGTPCSQSRCATGLRYAPKKCGE